MEKNNFFNYLLSIFKEILVFTNTFKFKFNIFFKKLITAIEIIFYIIKYYLEKNLFHYWNTFTNPIIVLEVKSLIFVILFSFFFYYFVVIELSIIVFGYSLLCYRFLFILIMACLIAAWRLEVEFLKEKMYEISPTIIFNWVKFYKQELPFSFYDFITDYKKKPLFRMIIVEKYWTDINEGRIILITFFSFLIFFYIYACAYRFDPRFVNFVAKYFHPVINFFETWKDPRLEDFLSATIRFWNWLFSYLEYSSETHTQFFEFFKNLTLASPWLEDRAHSQWNYKISLRKWVNFNDIHFLRAVSTQSYLRKIVFDVEQPIISDTRFDPNWKLLFFRYISQEFNSSKSSFWKNYFSENIFFWDLIKNYKKDINWLSDSSIALTKNNYSAEKLFSATTNEIVLAQNYFNKDFLDSKPYFQTYGTNWDYYHNIVLNHKIEKTLNEDVLKEFFAVTAYHNSPYTLSGLRNFHKNNNFNYKKNSVFLEQKEFFKQGLNVAYEWFNLKDYNDFKDSIKFDLNIPLYNFYTMENFENVPTRILKLFFSQPLYLNQLETLYYSYNFWLNCLEHDLGLVETPFWKKFEEDFSIDFIVNLINKRIRWIKNVVNNEGFSSFLLNELVTVEDFNYYSKKYFKLSTFIPVLERKTLKDTYRGGVEKKKVLEKKINKSIWFTVSEINNFIDMESELRSLERLNGLRPLVEEKIINKDYNFINKKTDLPWYILSLKYFATGDFKFVLPGFVWYYYPTPYPSAFSTFGSIWNWYQFLQRNKGSTVVGYSDSLAEIWNSTPIALYSGVEAILYIKPVLDLFDYFVKLFIKLVNYIIELIITQKYYSPLTSILSLAFFVHLIWFLHFYIYTFVLGYLIYYFFIYYFRKIGFLWFYERLFQENFLMSYTNWSFWHPVTELWYNYRSPEQFLILALQTNLLIHYSLFNYNN